MAEHDKVLYALHDEIQPRDFERLCVDLLATEGYRHIEPGGGNKDQGKDAEIRFWTAASHQCAVVAFQFSLERKWERKLSSDATKIAKSDSDVGEMVFVTSQKVTGVRKHQLRAEFKTKRKWELTIYDREWLRHRLTDFHQDLAKKYLGLDLPPTVCYEAIQIELSGFDEDSAKEIFQQTSPELIRASMLESTRKEPSIVGNWVRLARTEYLLRNYDGALEAINKAFQLEPQDILLKLNLPLFKGAMLAEKGIRDHSRPLLVQAKEILSAAVTTCKRAEDHYNLANVLEALGETNEAGKHYLRCVTLKPDYAQAWKNLGSVFIQRRKYELGIECNSPFALLQATL
jgi:tetratricopeptide (TPR) repeat protein